MSEHEKFREIKNKFDEHFSEILMITKYNLYAKKKKILNQKLSKN